MDEIPRTSPVMVMPDGADPVVVDDILDPDPAPEPAPSVESSSPAPDLQEDTEAVRAAEQARDKVYGDPIQPDQVYSEQEIWADPLEVLLSAEAFEMPTKEVKFERPNGVRFKLQFKALPTARYNRIQNDHIVRRRDKQTGEITTTLKDREMKVQVIVEACTNLNFADKQLWRRYGVQDIHSCVERVLLPGEIDQAALVVRELCGFNLGFLEEEAGNS